MYSLSKCQSSGPGRQTSHSFKTQITQAGYEFRFIVRPERLTSIKSSLTSSCGASGRCSHTPHDICRLQGKNMLTWFKGFLQRDEVKTVYGTKPFVRVFRHWPLLKFQTFRQPSFPPVMSLETHRHAAG